MPEPKNRKRVALEVVVIVGSILLAFWIQAWWDGRQAAALEQELLTSLADGFEENRRQAEAVIGEARRQQTFIGRFIGMSAVEAERISPDSVYIPPVSLAPELRHADSRRASVRTRSQQRCPSRHT